MRDRLWQLMSLLAVFAVFGGMQYWAVKAREREWWWLGGGPNHMTFLDLSDASSSEGHFLLVERVPEDEMTGRFEYKFSWSCQKKVVKWGTMWEKDDKLEQVQRHPAQRDQARPHAPNDAMERDALALACSTPAERTKLHTIRVNRSPVRFAHDAFALVAQGVKPFDALMRAAGRITK